VDLRTDDGGSGAALGSLSLNLVQEILYELIEAAKPSSLLCISSGPSPSSIRQLMAHRPECEVTLVDAASALDALAGMGRFDYAILSRALEPLEPRDGAAVIARVRDVHCHRFALACRHVDAHHRDGVWSEPELLALALVLHRRVREDGV